MTRVGAFDTGRGRRRVLEIASELIIELAENLELDEVMVSSLTLLGSEVEVELEPDDTALSIPDERSFALVG